MDLDQNEVRRALDEQHVDAKAPIIQQTLLTMFSGLMSHDTGKLGEVLQAASPNAGQSDYKPKKFKDDDNHDVTKRFSVLEAYAKANIWSDEKFVTRLPS